MDSSQVIEALQQILPRSQLVLRGTDEFHSLNSSYLSALESDITPAATFTPKSKDEVVAFVQTIKPFVESSGTGFAIRSAGQQPAPGCANIQDGITLDLRYLDAVEVKDDALFVGAGARWGAVYEKATEVALGVCGSRSADSGIGGLALSGGLSFFSSREGFVCDNVLNYEVVLASGEIVNANAKENADLWLALRGGGNNFGIVTQYTLRTFAQSRFWGGSVYYFAPSFPSQITSLVTELQKPDASVETHLMVSIGFAAQFGPQPMCMNQMYYTREVEKPDVLKPFVEVSPQIEQMNTMRMMNLMEAASEQAGDATNGKRCAYMNTTVKADIKTLQAAADLYTAAVGPIAGTEGLICSLTLQPYSRSCLEKSVANGGYSLGLDPSTGPLVSILLLTYWANKSDDEVIFSTMRGALEQIERDSVGRGTAVPFKFMNYAATFQDPIGSYGEENKKKLQEVSRKYDPEGLFQKGVPGGWKLFA